MGELGLRIWHLPVHSVKTFLWGIGWAKCAQVSSKLPLDKGLLRKRPRSHLWLLSTWNTAISNRDALEHKLHMSLEDSEQIKDLRSLVNTCIIALITLGVGTVAQGCKVWGSHKAKQTQLCWLCVERRILKHGIKYSISKLKSPVSLRFGEGGY